MTQTISLFDGLFAAARRQAACQQIRLALATLRRLSGLPGLSSTESEQVNALMGELLLRRRKYRQARIRLLAAARLGRTNPKYFYLLGMACRYDPDCDLERAARYFARCLRLAPTHGRCLGEAGLLAITQGDSERGLQLLQRAVELQPDNAQAIARLCRGLCRAGRPEEALHQLRLAQFRLPRCHKLRCLSVELRLDRLRCRQECDASLEEAPGPILLPFFGVVNSDGQTPVRLDDAQPIRGPHLMRMHRRRSWRKAP
jgi:tetratricopeptide (TPR) repeat protein